MQPIDQMSTLGVYTRWPNSISGARYQRVTTSCVRVGSGTVKERARPKSAILTSPASLMSTFCGLRSLWMMRLLWQ